MFVSIPKICRDTDIRKDLRPNTMAINSNGIEGVLYVESNFDDKNTAVLKLVATNNNPAPVEAFNFQAAVTKVCYYLLYKIYKWWEICTYLWYCIDNSKKKTVKFLVGAPQFISKWLDDSTWWMSFAVGKQLRMTSITLMRLAFWYKHDAHKGVSFDFFV